MALDHREVIELAEHDYMSDRDNRDDAIGDLHFLAGDQWDDAAKAEREKDLKPVITVNRMGGFVRQVSGDLRQSAPAIDPIPVDDLGGDEELTDVMGGLIRHIEYQSGAASVYSWGGEMAVSCGIGHWRVNTMVTEDSVWEQEIKIQRILDPLSVIWDSNAIELDRSDAKHCFVTEMMSRAAFKERFPKASITDFPSGISDETAFFWATEDQVRVAEYWRLEPIEKEFGLTQDGQTLDLESAAAQKVPGFVKTRKVKTHKVLQRMMSGNEFLTEDNDWAGRFIPIVPVIGNEIPINGQVLRHGLIRWAKDPQRLYNYWRSVSAETIASSPKAPYIGTVEMFEGLEDYWDNANTTSRPYIPYNKDEENPLARPQREAPPTAPVAMWQEANVAVDDLKATTGLHDPSIGAEESGAKSGRAIIALQRKGDVGSFIYFDNFNVSIRRTGHILVDLIPKIYDTQRTVRILGKDETERFTTINKEDFDLDGNPTISNDLSAGRFDVRIKTGPTFASAMIEAQERLGQILDGNPELFQIFGDLYLETLDFPGSEKLAERMKKAMDPALVGDENEEPQPVDPVAEIMQRAQMAGIQLDVAQKEAELEKTEAETDKIEAETVKELADVQTRRDSLDLKALEMGEKRRETQF